MKIITNDIAASSEQIANQVKDLLAEKPDAVLGVSFGRDLIPVYQKLKELGQAGELPFGDVRVFVCCEYRDLDKEHEGSVHSYMKNNLFDGAGFNESNIFYPCLCSEDEDKLKEYDEQISAAGGIDLMILGIGINGSIGFNEPATPFESYTHAQLLTDKTKKLVAEDFGGAENVPEKGVTMGIKTIVSAKYIDLIAAGEEKADAVHKIVYGKTIPFVPASMLQIHMNLNLYVDSAAASDI
ncbi:MAG: glucosamine-6-phosphate deaminase [Oscillospiraceae bacterium]|nr:glucosamine-6-phosphate deaminase [Oscillospiraceae bacterium]